MASPRSLLQPVPTDSDTFFLGDWLPRGQGPRSAPSILGEHSGRYADHNRSWSAMSHWQYNLATKPEGDTTRAQKRQAVPQSVAYPLVRNLMNKSKTTGSTNASTSSPVANGNLPNISSWSLVDSMQPVFSDEFETDGRSFCPRDDLCVLFLFGASGYEVTTKNGALEITLSKVDDVSTNYSFSYRSGMISWNKFCFTGGILVPSVTPPGTTNVLGPWPAVWAMGSLGRAGMARVSMALSSLSSFPPLPATPLPALLVSHPILLNTLSSTLTSLTLNRSGPTPTTPATSAPSPTRRSRTTGPQAAFNTGGNNKDAELSFSARAAAERVYVCRAWIGFSLSSSSRLLIGIKSDGSFVGRSAPEIDVIEATISGGLIGQVQSAHHICGCKRIRAFSVCAGSRCMPRTGMVRPHTSARAQRSSGAFG
ncbi:beta-glucan synthesis-associated protein-domain-containing protein [Mycena alexandri]|uniref:Beta-glucan synthesis-associated protein-domain-containing protein n=1 Tax=Mycena alexandri TaxID=1745969 RepID=A0AAD6RZG0_9AGAR|nr:beta-glucan synthesis-associated protein-domain-containing protein [Mycena alexandri]